MLREGSYLRVIPLLRMFMHNTSAEENKEETSLFSVEEDKNNDEKGKAGQSHYFDISDL